MKKATRAMSWIAAAIISAGVASCGACTMKTKPISEAGTPSGWPEPTAIGKIELKEYPAARLAVVQSDAAGESNSMFRNLFKHIKANDIPMTAPVEMTYAVASDTDDDAGMSRKSMAFYYKDQSVGTAGRQDNVEVIDVEAVTVVSIGLKGSYSDGNYLKAHTKLLTWLDENTDSYAPAGSPRILAYNSPFVPWFMKYSEVQIPIEKLVSSEGIP